MDCKELMVIIQQTLVSKDVQMVVTEMLILQTASVSKPVLEQPLLTILRCFVLMSALQILLLSDIEETGLVCKPVLESSGLTVQLEPVSPLAEVTLGLAI